MSRKPEFGFLVAWLSLVVLALGWAMALLPVAIFPLSLSADEHGAYVAGLRKGPGMNAAGIERGDRLDLSTLTYTERLRLQTGGPPGYALTLHVRHNGGWSDRAVVATPSPLPLDDPRWWSLMVALTVGVLISAVVVARRPSVATAAFAFYTWGNLPSFRFVALFGWLPDAVFGVVGTLVEALTSEFPLFLLLVFVTRFPAEPSSRSGRLRMRFADAMVFVGGATCAVFAIFEPVRHHSWVNVGILYGMVVVAIGAVLAALQFREASGEDRRRIGWVLIGYGVTLVCFVWSNALITSSVAAPIELQAATQLANIALPLALAYAILRHRVLDVGFALNRTVVYATVTTVIVIAVSVVDWLSGKLIGERRLALAAEAAVTIALGVGLNAMHERVGRLVERVLFRARHIAERRLRNGIGAIAFATSDGAVERAVTDEVSTALGLCSTALFRLDQETRRFRCVRATGWPDAPATIEEDALLVRTVRLRERPFYLADFGIVEPILPAGPGAPMIAVPVADRHTLLGFVLYGALSDGTAPDPELVDLLGQLGAAAASAWAYVEARAARARLADVEKVLAGVAAPSSSSGEELLA
jgi:hypothetical protein